jgi:hypothetical protein
MDAQALYGSNRGASDKLVERVVDEMNYQPTFPENPPPKFKSGFYADVRELTPEEIRTIVASVASGNAISFPRFQIFSDNELTEEEREKYEFLSLPPNAPYTLNPRPLVRWWLLAMLAVVIGIKLAVFYGVVRL